MTSIMAVLAQWEREIVSERTAAALAHKIELKGRSMRELRAAKLEANS